MDVSRAAFHVQFIRFLSIIFFVGGLGRVLSWVTMGRPHSFQIVLMIFELVVPVVFLALVRDPKKLTQRLPDSEG